MFSFYEKLFFKKIEFFLKIRNNIKYITFDKQNVINSKFSIMFLFDLLKL